VSFFVMSTSKNGNTTTSDAFNTSITSSLYQSQSLLNNTEQNEPPPKKLELTINPEDGSLQTATLYQVILAATDALYTDLYNMAQGEIDVYTTTTTTKSNTTTGGGGGGATPKQSLSQQQPNDNDTTGNADDEETSEALQKQKQQQSSSFSSGSIEPKKERMTNLSFAQRRHELSWRLSQNMKCIQQIAALTSAAACTDLGSIVQVSTKALQHTRTAWVQADEAQDALYFFHAQLFPARVAPHDIYGACDVLLHGRWYDLPHDMLLNVDKYENSVESTWSKVETDQRWQLTVRDKLIMGEVGWMRRQQLANSSFRPPLWKVTLNGGIVKLTAGRPKYISSVDNISGSRSSSKTKKYPIEALLTLFPSPYNMWTLMSVEVNVQVKTGESDHQLEMSNRQRYDLHRIAAKAMRREEIRYNQGRATAEISKFGSATLPSNENDDIATADQIESQPPLSRPLQALFHVTHQFLMAWQLEVLSAQAQALRRGVWAATEGTSLSVTPVRFYDNSDGHMSISFWKVDDSYGPPSMGDLNRNNNIDNVSTSTTKTKSTTNRNVATSSTVSEPESQLKLTIRAESTFGIIVSLSGGTSMMSCTGQRRHKIQATIKNLIQAATNPMALSASDALLAATVLCADFKCHAVVESLQPKSSNGAKILPSWIRLSVESGCISVAINVNYHGVSKERLSSFNKSILFHMICDARTGSFVTTFPPSMHLLRQLVCDDIHASAPVALRVASVPINRRRVAGSNSTGRVVREAFDSLIRSMNLLGQRVGVGGLWDDIDDKSYLLRQRAVQVACVDVKTALMPCCGMSALYGIVPLATGCAVGLDAIPDM
jgi:hypothetical protein